MHHAMIATDRVYAGLNALIIANSTELPDEQDFFFDLKCAEILNN